MDTNAYVAFLVVGTLMVIAVAHANAISVLTRMREEQPAEDYHIRVLPGQVRAPVDRNLSDPTVQPVLGQAGRATPARPVLPARVPRSGRASPTFRSCEFCVPVARNVELARWERGTRDGNGQRITGRA